MVGRSRRIVASTIGAIGVILWATETTLLTYTVAIPPFQTVALAFMFAAAMSPLIWFVTKTNPLIAFKQPPQVWLLTVTSLVGYHASIYYATQKAPPAAAALLQGTTPLMIVLGSAFLPGERLKWWHLVGAAMGFAGVLNLVEGGSTATSEGAVFYLCVIGVAAGLWGLYSVITRTLPDVPTSALGHFYAASAIVALVAHACLEEWVYPSESEWLAVAALGCLPMGLAIYFWDFGLKRGDIQALGAFSYVEPFVGAVLVALFTKAVFDISLLWSGILVVSGAVIASASLWRRSSHIAPRGEEPSQGAALLHALSEVASLGDLRRVSDAIVERLSATGRAGSDDRINESELRYLRHALAVTNELWVELARDGSEHWSADTKAA